MYEQHARPEMQTPEEFAAAEIQKLATGELENLNERHPGVLGFDISEWTRNAKAEAQNIPDIFAYHPEGTDKFIVEFPAGTRPAEAIQSLVQAIKQGDGPGTSWLPIAQKDAIGAAFKAGRAVSADAVEQHGIRPPRRYVKEGGIYRTMDRPATRAQPTSNRKG